MAAVIRHVFSLSCSSVGKIFNKCRPTALIQCRTLYGHQYTGLDGFERTQLRCKDQMEGAQEKFCERMDHYLAQPEKNMIFTEDLKSMIHLAETDKDVDLVMRMMKQFNSQNKEMRFGSFTFGPVVMRMFCLLKKPLEALEAMKSPELEGFFDQVSSFFILMDLLYKHELYQEVLDTYQLLRGRELERARYPRDCIILCLAACYRMDTPAAYEWATALARECGETGRPMPRRAIAFLAMLALNRGDPAAALEVLFTLREVNYITTRNLKLIALADLDRVDEALPVLRYVIERDVPETATRRGQEVCATTLARVRAAVERAQREELTAQFSHLERALAEGDHVAKVDIAEIVTTPILERRPPPQQRQDYQPSGAYNQRYRSQARGQGYYDRQQHDRPGLSDRYDT